MNASVHLSTQQISDLLVGALPAADAMELNAHLASCAACQELRDDLLDLISLLEDEGATPVVMPDDVAASLDLALLEASTERAVRRPGGRQPWKWLAGAAAAAAVVSLGVAGIRAIPAQNTNTDDAGASAPHVAQDGGSLQNRENENGSLAAPAKGDFAFGIARLPVTAAEVPAVARRLSTVSGPMLHPPAEIAAGASPGCARPLTGDRFTVIRFEGQRAVLSVDPTTRLATVYDCATATKTLFVSGY